MSDPVFFYLLGVGSTVLALGFIGLVVLSVKEWRSGLKESRLSELERAWRRGQRE